IPTMGGWVYQGGTPFTVCGFSSYGTTSDGRTLPHAIAPGSPIVSSFSGPYVAEQGVNYCAFEDEGHYWGIESGTSMSSPYVAGGIATWLQANPALNYRDVQNVLAATNRREEYALSENPRHGSGAFDPYAGLKMVVENTLTKVENILGVSLFAEYNGGILKILNPDGRRVLMEVFTSDGLRIAEADAGSDELISVSAEVLNPAGRKGFAICRISAPGTSPRSVKVFSDSG
ncbi:MAG: S8 family serine peptidase, partial [Muribaculaceae bacterium]|nr:S8 family serine peptidase [Muribaculaceae bacterium]